MQINFYPYILLLLLSCFCFYDVSAQKQRGIPNYSIESVSLGQDITSTEINCLFQCSNGYIWIGTKNGVSRFDGYEFENFTTFEGASLAHIFDIVEDQNGIIWAGGEKGLFYFNENAVHRPNLVSLQIQTLDLDLTGNLYVAGINHAPFKLSKDNLELLVAGKSADIDLLFDQNYYYQNQDLNRIWDITTDDDGEVYLGTDNNLIKVEQKKSKIIWESTVPNIKVSEIIAIHSDSVYWGSQVTGLYFKNRNTIEKISAPATHMMARSDTTLDFLSTMDLIRINASSWDTLSDLESIDHLYFKDMLTDREGNTWIASEGNLFKLTPTYFQSWTIKESPLLQSNHSILQDNKGKIIIGSSKKNILGFDGRNFILENEIPAMHNSVTEGMLQVGEKEMMYATSMSGLITYKNNAWNIYNKDQGLIDKTLLFIKEDRFGRKWTGGENGISLIKDIDGAISFENFTPSDDLTTMPRFNNVIALDSSFIISTSDTKIYRVDQLSLYSYNIDELDIHPQITASAFYEDYKILISTLDAGIILLNFKDKNLVQIEKSWSKTNGLPTNNFLNVHIDKKKRIWAFHLNGVCVIEEGNIHCYNNYDGWHTMTTTHMDIIETKDSMLWAVGNNTITRFPLYKLPINTIPPKAFVRDVQLFEGRENINLYTSDPENKNKLELPFNKNFINFEFYTTSHTRSEKNMFIFQLEGLDENWSKPTSITTASYPGLKPGKYTFKVIALNNSGLHSLNPAEYHFRINPPWYWAWWSISLYILSFLVGIYFLTLLYWGRKKREVEAIKLKEILSFQSKFYTNITHEFRTPLTVIMGISGQLKNDDSIDNLPKGKEKIDMINRNANKLFQLVNQILHLSKIDNHQLKLDMRSGNMVEFIEKEIINFRPYTDLKDIDLILYSEDHKIMMDFDREAITSVLHNLLSNAIKHSPKKSKIIIHLKKVKEESEFLFLKVKDQGHGIPEKELKTIFDRFRGSEGLHENSMGIGLSLTKDLIEMMGGDIQVTSKIGVGSEFVFKIPINNKSLVKHEIPLEAKSAKQELTTFNLNTNTNPGKPTILIIEDQIDVALFTQSILRQHYNIWYAENGEEGLEIARTKKPDLILTDIMMDGISGYQVCEEIKNNPFTSHISVVLVSAKASQQERIYGMSKKADAYISKPFTQSELLSQIQLTLKNSEIKGKIESDNLLQLIKEGKNEETSKFINRTIEIILENKSNPVFGPPLFAKLMGVSESQLYKKLKKYTGKSTALYIRTIKLNQAKEDILATDHSVSKIAEMYGFNDTSWFSNSFKKEFGYAPSDLKK